MSNGILVETTELAITSELWQKLQAAVWLVLLHEPVEITAKWTLFKDPIWNRKQEIDVIKQFVMTPSGTVIEIENTRGDCSKYDLPVADPKANMLKFKDLVCALADFKDITQKIRDTDYLFLNKTPTGKQLMAEFIGIDTFQYTMRLVEAKV